MSWNDIMSELVRVYLLSCPCRLLLSRVSLHIAHASSVPRTPVTIVKMPIMRFIVVSVERFRGKISLSEGVGKADEADKGQ